MTNNPLKYVDPSGHCEKNSDGEYVSQECVEIASRVASEWKIGLDEALSMDLKYGSDPYWSGGDDRINFNPFSLNVNGKERFVQVGDKWAFEVNFLDAENKALHFSEIVLANREDTAFANFANSAEKYANMREQFRDSLEQIDSDLIQFSLGGIATTFNLMVLPATIATAPPSGGLTTSLVIGETGMMGTGLVAMGLSVKDMYSTAVDIASTDIPAIRNAQKQAYGAGSYLEPIGHPNYQR